MHFSTMTIDQTSVFITLLVVILLIVLSVLRYKRMVVCKHKYVLFKEIEVMQKGLQYPTHRQYILQCEHCGKMKKEEF